MTWINVNDKLPEVKTGKYRVRTEKDIEMNAFYYEDAMSWIAFYHQKTSHWWEANYPYKRLDDVIEWKDKKD